VRWLRRVAKRRFIIGPLLLRRVGGTVRALLLETGRELTVRLDEVLRAYMSRGGLALLLETGRVDYFKWHAADLRVAGRRVAAIGDWVCPSCGDSLYRNRCNGCDVEATPRILWVDRMATQALMPVERGPRGPMIGGRTLSPWEVIEVYTDPYGRQLAKALIIGEAAHERAEQLLRISPDWFRRPIIGVEGV
jgi:hypothetical protein